MCHIIPDLAGSNFIHNLIINKGEIGVKWNEIFCMCRNCILMCTGSSRSVIGLFP